MDSLVSSSSSSSSSSFRPDSHGQLLFYLSKSSSMISLSMWLFAQIPQIILNYHQKQVSLSIPFLFMVTISDFINLAYQVVVKDNVYSILLIYSSILNLVIISQYFYYTKYPPKPNTPQIEPPTLVNRILGSAFMANTVLSMTINYDQKQEVIHPNLQFTLRETLSLSSSTLYILLRIPQIHKNYKRKSASGLSIYMILLVLFGNIFNVISIFSDPYLFKIYSHDTYLIGSIGTIIMDLFLVCQFWIYRKVNRVDNHVSEFINIDEHPQWYVKNQPLVLYQQEFQQQSPQRQDYISKGYDNSLVPNQPRGRKLVKSPGELTMLLSESVNQFTTPPPQHYIVSSSLRYQLASSGSVNPVPKTIPKSLTSSSVGSATSFIPSIIGNISSVNKKLLDGSKVPFLPIDFLADDFYTSPSMKESNASSASHAAYYGSVDV